MQPMKLIPATKDYIWGGTKLKNEWNKISDTDKIAESWELSCHAQGMSTIADGEYAGKTLKEILTPEMLGTNAAKFEFFPILVKLIDAKENLSIQVHPSDDYALKNEGQYGKTEMWYVVDAEEGSGVYCGFKKPYSIEEVEKVLREGDITTLLNFVPAKKGDTLFIKSGTVHAICGGLLICEIQQNSSLTYRLYDYNRTDAKGNKRELHIDKAVKVIDSNIVVHANETVKKVNDNVNELARSQYFTCYSVNVNGETEIEVGSDSFVGFTCVEGEGAVVYNGVTSAVNRGDTYFLPAGMGQVTLTGNMKVISYKV